MFSWQEYYVSAIALTIIRAFVCHPGCGEARWYPCVSSTGHLFLKTLTVICQQTAIINIQIHDDHDVMSTSVVYLLPSHQ